MRIYKLKEIKDRYMTVYEFGKKPQLYLIIPINEEDGIAIWIKEL